MIDPWQIHVLGGLAAVRQGQRIDRFRTRATGTLLAYLALSLGRVHSRDELSYILWPDDDPDAARHKLRVALSSLRRQLEPPGTPMGTVLVAGRVEVHLNADVVSTDLQQFESAIRAARQPGPSGAQLHRWQLAIRLYAGELLPGRDEEWLLPKRTHLNELFLGGLKELSALHEGLGDTEGALLHLKRILMLDPYREEIQRQVMRLYAATGRAGEAARQFQEYCRLLAAELKTVPSAETLRLFELVREGRLADRGSRSTSSGGLPAVTDGEGLAALQPSPGTETGQELGSLPVPVARFFGREIELALLLRSLAPLGDEALCPGNPLVGEARLVTLLGPGGVGKTRLALEAGRRLSQAYRGAVWYIPLADVQPSQSIVEPVLSALRITSLPETDPFSRLLQVVANRPTLLILDNAEHLVSGVASLVLQLLEQAPGLKCLVTSRVVLNLGGELEMLLAPLPLPDKDAAPELLAANPCIQLFLDRARRISPDFQVTAGNARDLSLLAARLEGLPLSLELAAARTRLFSPRQMLPQLENRFEFLTTQRRDLSDRHRSLRAIIDWSYQLLSEELRAAFVSLSVFRGGSTFADAEAVIGAREMMNRVQELRDASLVQVDSAHDHRLVMLESVREYAQERMDPVQLARLRQKHGEHFAQLASQQIAHLNTQLEPAALERLQREQENLRAAFAWAQLASAPVPLLLIALGLGHLLHRRGLVSEARFIVDEAAAVSRQMEFGDSSLREDVLALRASVLLDCNLVAAAMLDAEEVRRLTTARQDTQGEALAINLLGLAARERGENADARLLFGEALAAAFRCNDFLRAAMVHNNLGMLEDETAGGCPDQAVRHFEEALALFSRCGYRRGEAEVLTNLGALYQGRGDVDTCWGLYHQALQIELQLQHVLGVGRVLFNLAEVASLFPALGDARQLSLAAVEALTRAGSPYRQDAERLLGMLPATRAVHRDAVDQENRVRQLTLDELAIWARGASQPAGRAPAA